MMRWISSTKVLFRYGRKCMWAQHICNSRGGAYPTGGILILVLGLEALEQQLEDVQAREEFKGDSAEGADVIVRAEEPGINCTPRPAKAN